MPPCELISSTNAAIAPLSGSLVSDRPVSCATRPLLALGNTIRIEFAVTPRSVAPPLLNALADGLGLVPLADAETRPVEDTPGIGDPGAPGESEPALVV